MNLLKRSVRFLIFSNVFVSLCVVALCQSTSLILDVKTSHILPFVFFSTLFGYNFQRLVRFKPSQSHSTHLNWIARHRKLLIWTTILSCFLAVFFALELSISAFYLLVPSSVISLLYPVKFFSFKNKKVTLRELPCLKLFLIAFVWTLVSVGLVIVESKILLTLESLLLLFSRFFFVLAITIPFDIRDLKFDDPSMCTIPQIIGEENAKLLALICLAVFDLLTIVHYFTYNFSITLLTALLLTSLFTGFLIFKTNQSKQNYFFAFWMESTSIIMYLLLFIIPLAFGIFVP